MPIYTRTGDAGTTSIFGGRRLSKSDLQIEAYGSIDELTSFIGLVIAKCKNRDEKRLLTTIQKSLYKIMSHLSSGTVDLGHLEEEIMMFEKAIDKITKKLPALHRFVLPQGSELASLYHIARAVCRRAERNVVEFAHQKKTMQPSDYLTIKYLNRMSDLFFTLARKNVKGKEVVT